MAAKELLLWCIALVWLSALTEAVEKAPVVQVYSRYPVENGKENTLHCFTEDFHPPKINVTLLKNNVKITDTKQVEHSALQVPIVVKWDASY
uniref:Immunoglobulin C1-set domain-containing protein n=1 Tax=Ailuropoda melanoleuca TaxID=9646 RepID=A0A7N5JY37_AILME